jgi:hypothetical protein
MSVRELNGFPVVQLDGSALPKANLRWPFDREEDVKIIKETTKGERVTLEEIPRAKYTVKGILR